MFKNCEGLKEKEDYWIGLWKKDKKDWEDIEGNKYGENSDFEGIYILELSLF